RYDKARQELMTAQLKRIISTEAISRDVYEVASKSLL
ncbi:MAG: aminopeptidase N C-terminal domain-containing protein, partial [Methylobacter sp.]